MKRTAKNMLLVGFLSFSLLPFNIYAKDDCKDIIYELPKGKIEDALEIHLEKKGEDEVKIDSNINTKTKDMVKVIVEFTPAPEVKGEDYKSELEIFEEFIDELNKGVKSDEDKINIKHKYKLVYNGASLSIPGDRVEELLKCPVVKRVHEDKQIKLDPPIIQKPSVM